MKFKKMKSIFTILSLVTLILTGSVVSMGNSINSENSNSVTKSGLLRVKVKSQYIDGLSFNTFSTLSANDSNETGVFVVTNETVDESKPSIVTHLDSALVAYEYEDENGTHVALRSSKDHGQTWPGFQDVFHDVGVNLSYPSLTVKPGSGKGYGTLISSKNDSGIIYYLEFLNIGNLNTLSISYVDWSDLRNIDDHEDEKFWGFKDADIVYNHTNTMTQFIAVVIGSTDFEVDGEGPCNDCPMFFYRDPLDVHDSWIAWDPTFENCRNISAVMDHSSNILYGVCEIQNGSNKDLLFFNDNPTLWSPTSVLTNQTISSSENLMHPNIFLKDNNIYIAAETDTQGLILYNSSDDGKNWNITNITSPVLNAKSPNLYANDTHLACFFVESGNLSMKTTINNGENWSEPVQINDYNGTVDSSYRNFDVGNMYKIVWTDIRNDSKDLYYLLDYIPKLDLEVTDFTLVKDDIFPTYNWILMNVTNVGDAPSSAIKLNITYACEGENATDTGYFGYYPSVGVNKTVTIKRPLFRFNDPGFFQSLIAFAGIKNITVYLDPKTVTDDLNPANNIYQKDILYEQIFPKLAPFENLFKRLKKD
jgi:hypothetical protein